MILNNLFSTKMLHLSIIQAMKFIAADYALNPGSLPLRVPVSTGQAVRCDISELAKLVVSNLTCCSIASCGSDSFVLDWDCFVATVKFEVGNDGLDVAMVSMDHEDEMLDD